MLIKNEGEFVCHFFDTVLLGDIIRRPERVDRFLDFTSQSSLEFRPSEGVVIHQALYIVVGHTVEDGFAFFFCTATEVGVGLEQGVLCVFQYLVREEVQPFVQGYDGRIGLILGNQAHGQCGILVACLF